MSEPYTQDTVELVARELCNLQLSLPSGHDSWPLIGPETRGSFLARAATILDTLATAGLLLPPGAITREEWRSHNLTSGGWIECETREQAERFAAQHPIPMTRIAEHRVLITTPWTETP